MSTRSKVVELNGQRYEIRKLAPDVGSFIFMRMMGLSLRSRASEKEQAEESSRPATTAEPVKISGEMQVRALAFSVFAGAIGLDDFKLIQNACIKSVSKQNPKTNFFMPVMTDGGQYTPDGEDVENNIGLVMNLTTEVLIFCFADFFESPSLGT